MRKITLKQFRELADAGRNGNWRMPPIPGEEFCENSFEYFVAEGNSFADICHDYASRNGYGDPKFAGREEESLNAGLSELINDVVQTALTLSKRSTQGALTSHLEKKK